MLQRPKDGQSRVAARSLRAGVVTAAVGLIALAGCTTHRDYEAAPAPTTILTSANGGVGVTSPPAGETLPPLVTQTTMVASQSPVTNPDGSSATTLVASSPPPVPSSSVGTPGATPATTPPKTTPTTIGTGQGATPTTIKNTPVTAAPASTCKEKGSTGGVSKDAGSLSTVVGADIRSGLHECFERVVIEFKGDGAFPGFSVQYGNAGVAGTAALLVTVGASMSGGGTGYLGPNDITPGLSFVKELKLITDDGSQSVWAIGLDQQRKFTVSRESSPARLVIDIQR